MNERAQITFDSQQRVILERIASGAPLGEVLERIALMIEERGSAQQLELLCSILLLDARKNTLRHAAAPSLPGKYIRAIDDLSIGPNAGSCGAAAFSATRVIVTDITTHENWLPYRELTRDTQLRACWSTPILSHDGVMLGTYAIYYREARAPSADEIAWVDAAVHLAAIAIGNEQTRADLLASETRFRSIVDTAFEGVWQIDRDGRTLFVNQRMADMLGYSVAELQNFVIYELAHPNDRQQVKQQFISRASEQRDWRFIRKDKRELWCIVASAPTHDEHGAVSGALAMVTNINERKQTEARLRRLSRLYAVSSSVSEVIVRTRDAQELYRSACHIAVEQGEVRLAWIALRDQHTGQLNLVSQHGGHEAFVARVIERIRSEPKQPGPAGRALRDGVGAVTNDISADDTFFWKQDALEIGLQSCAVLPLHFENKAVGLMALYADQLGFFSHEEFRVLSSLAADISFAVESSIKEIARQQSAEALRENERMVATLFSNLPGMAYRCRNDAEWTIELLSPGCRDLTGYAPEDFKERRSVSYEELIHPLDREAVRLQVERGLVHQHPFEMVYRIITAQGVQKWVWDRGRGIFGENGELRFLEGFITDVTARREAEEQVAAQAALLDKAKDAIILCSLDDTVIYWNKGAENVFGWPAQGALGEKITSLNCRNVEQRARLIAELLATGEWSGELTHYAKDGREVAVEASWTLVRDDVGKPRSILEINTDITLRKKLEQQFLNAQRLESLGTLAGGIAHDFNNILTAITGNAKLGSSDLPADHPVRTPLREIEKAGLRATDLVRQILTFSQQQTVRRKVLALGGVIDEALQLLRTTVPPHIKIQAHYADDTPDVAADATQIHQVLMNLGTNAIHAMHAHGGTLTVKLDSVTLDTTLVGVNVGDITFAVPPGRYARLTISDTGTGMDAQTLARIFEPFFTTKSQGKGTGLGLSVVHGILRGHDGGVTVHSQHGDGTTFCIYFPAAKLNTENTQSLVISPIAPPAQQSRGEGQRILYVDDEEALVFLTTRVLERLGYSVTGHIDARQALAQFATDPLQFDAVVSDLSMPTMTGPELAREILSLRPDIPVVLTSGYLRDEDMKTVRNLGIRDLVLKPNTVEDLGETLHRVLKQKRPVVS